MQERGGAQSARGCRKAGHHLFRHASDPGSPLGTPAPYRLPSGYCRYHHVDPVIRLHGRGSVEMPWKNNRLTNIFHKWWNGVDDHK